jgi:hypothetical protein
MSKKSNLLRLAAVAAGLVGLAPAAYACSVCGCGDPLLDASDPAATTGRLRLALDTEYLDVDAGNEEDPSLVDHLKQYTLKLQAVYAPVDRLSLVATLPFTRKDLSTAGLTSSDLSGLGDVEFAARYTLLDIPNLAAQRRQTFAVSAGTSLPTGSNSATDANGRIDEHGQLGTGAWGPFAGLHYRVEQGPWIGSASVSARLHSMNSFHYKYATAAMWSVHGQYRPIARVALDLGVDGRWAGQDRDELGLVDHTGGTVLAIAPGAYFHVGGGLWLSARAQLPFYTDLVGNQSIGPTVVAGMQYQVF